MVKHFDNNMIVCTVKQILIDFQLTQHVTDPTHVSSSSDTLIDHITI